ncbi:UNVERIFIED_CONTAM: hypothetical protein GTU68_062363 [Idotea baltica]
MPITL